MQNIRTARKRMSIDNLLDCCSLEQPQQRQANLHVVPRVTIRHMRSTSLQNKLFFLVQDSKLDQTLAPVLKMGKAMF